MGDNVNSRQRLKPWLESKIDSGTIPGLYWLDRDIKKFRIPWKRNGTSEWEKEDSAIFRDWAIHTGKYREGIDKIDYPYWKTRLRCALTKHPEIIECKEDKSSQGNDPYRVYRIIDNSACDEQLPTLEGDVEMVEDIHEGAMEIDLASDLKNINKSELIKLPIAEFSLLQDSLEAEILRYIEAVKSHNSFEVIINFQCKELLKELVKDCCFLTKLDSPQEIPVPYQVISFPDLPKTEQVQTITSVLWPNLKDGIYLKYDQYKNILARRLCKCRIYYSDQNKQNGLKLDRAIGDSWSLIFNYQKFRYDFANNVESISADTTLYIGQRCDPDPNKVFFSVDICHLEAKKQLKAMLLAKHKVSISM